MDASQLSDTRLAAVEAAHLQLQSEFAALAAEVSELRKAVAALKQKPAPEPTPEPSPFISSAKLPNQNQNQKEKEKDKDKDAAFKSQRNTRASASTNTAPPLLLKQSAAVEKPQQLQLLKKQGPLLSRRALGRAPSNVTDSEDEKIDFTVPPPPLLTSGEPNTLNYRAWTDIVRVRYPHFQRVLPAMSKATKYFREQHNLPEVRLVAQTSLKANVTHAIPEHLQHRFLRFMEDQFVHASTPLLFGDRSCLGGVSSNAGDDGTGNANGMGRKGGRMMVGNNGNSNDGNNKKRGSSDYEPSPLTKKLRSSSDDASVQEDDADADEEAEEPNALSAFSENVIVVSKNGIRMVRYNVILQKLMKDFKYLPKDARVAIKKGVKQFLKHELAEDFEDCIIETGGSASLHEPPVMTYGVPEFLVGEFKVWAVAELSRCFPACEILDWEL